MPEKLKLTALEQSALDKGLATERVRLKGGRIIWDQITEDLPHMTGNPNLDADRLWIFKQEVEKLTFYHKNALKEWLSAQIENGYTDLLSSNEAQSRQIEIYKKHLKVI